MGRREKRREEGGREGKREGKEREHLLRHTPSPLKVLVGGHLTADQCTNHVPVVEVKGQQGSYDAPL